MKKYGENMATMVKNMNDNQNKLIEILDKVFIYTVDASTNTKSITIHPKLSVKELEEIIALARKYIVNIMVGCENDFLTTLQSFEAIVENLIREGIENKVSNIRKQELANLTNK